MKSLIAVMVTLLSVSAAAAVELPRRGALGVQLQGSPQGVVVVNVADGPARDAGIEAGDVLQSINGMPTTTPGGFFRLTSSLRADENNTVSVLRDGQRIEISIVPAPMPLQSLPGAQADYDYITLESGDRVRTITFTPEHSDLASENGLPAVYYIQGIPCAPADNFANHQGQQNRLLIDLLEAGFVVALADKPGIGDSEGTACIEGGFNREVEAFRRAAEALTGRDGVDAARVYSVGLSMGGIQAPLVSETVDLAGIITWGTGVSPWFAYITENFRMRAMMQGQDAQSGDEFLRLVRSIWADLILEGQTAPEVRENRPEDVALFESQMGSLDFFAGRHFTFHQEIDAANNWAAWQQFDGRLLALQGEFDWVASEHDHRMAVEIVNAANPGHAVFEIIPGLDHGFTAHANRAGSFANAFAGESSDAFHERAVEWLVEQASQ